MKNPNTNLNALQADVFKSVQVLAKRAENEAPRRARTWERILRVSTRLFVDRGYPDVSIEDIAKATDAWKALLEDPSRERCEAVQARAANLTLTTSRQAVARRQLRWRRRWWCRSNWRGA